MRSEYGFIDRISDKLSGFLGPIGEKMSSIDSLSSISQTMLATTPVILLGSFATLIAYLDVGPWQSIVTSVPHLVEICSTITQFTTGLFSLYVLAIMTYMYGRKIGLKEHVPCIPVAIASFLIITPYTADGLPFEWLGTSGLITALLIGAIVPKFIKFAIDHNFRIRMPKSVPQFVEESFSILIPAIIVVMFFGILDSIMELSSYGSFQNMIFKIIQAPLSNVGLTLPGHLLITTLTAAVLWCGIHANAVSGPLVPLLLAASVENLNAYQSGAVPPHIIDNNFFQMLIPGGCGMLLVPAILAVFYCKSKQINSVGKVALIPAIFGIGEPVLFGLPVMLNPILFIPMILGVFVNNIVQYFALATGIVGRATGIVLPWTTPPIIYPLLTSTTPIPAAILQAVMIGLAFIIWIPFMRVYDKSLLKKEEEASQLLEK